MDLNKFYEILKNFTSSDKSVRQEAENIYLTLRKEQPCETVLLIIKALKYSENEEVRLQSAILIRNILNNYEEEINIYRKINDETKEILKTSLLSCLEVEQVNRVRINICDSISELAKCLIPLNEWSDLYNKLFIMINTNDFVQQRSAFRILGEIASTISYQLSNDANAIADIIYQSMASPDPTVRYECMGFITNIVEDGNKKVWKLLSNIVPKIVESINMMILSNYDFTGEFLQYVIRLTETNVLFFKPHLNGFVDELMAIANNEPYDEEYRQYAVEALICIAENKPKLAMNLKGYITRMVELLMKLMLEIKEEKYTTWLDSGEENPNDEQRNYDVGEEGIDRLIKSFSEYEEESKEAINAAYSIVGDFLRRPEWQFRFVAIMTISQTVEYVPEEILDEHLDHIIQMLLEHLKDADRHVRFAACQAIGQVSLDHQPYVQEKYYKEVLPALINAFDDSHHRVQSHAAAAFVNYCEELQKVHMLPYVDVVMQKLLSRIKIQTPRLVREQAITAIAVVAAVIEEHFFNYYSTVIPLMKDVIQNCLSQEERTCRGKAIECISIIGLSVGKEHFANDSHEIMNALLHIANSKLDDDDPVKEYAQEALGRMCRAMDENFVGYLNHIIPSLIDILSKQPKALNTVEAERDDEDMTMVMVADDKCVGLKTSMIEDQERALDLLSTFIEVLKEKFVDWIPPVTAALLPLLSYVLSDDVKQKALNTMADLLDAARAVLDHTKGDKSTLHSMLTSAADIIFKNLNDAHERLSTDLEIMIAEAAGLNDCIEKAGPNVLNAEIIKVFSEKVFKLLQQSSERRTQCSIRKHDEDIDEEDIENIEDEEQQEQNLRSSLVDVLGSLMQHHPDEFMQSAISSSLHFVHNYFQSNSSTDDRALALYVCDDMIAHLGKNVVAVWDSFMPRLIECITDEEPNVRQAACYGICQAALNKEFSKYAQQSATRLLLILKNPLTKGKDNMLATDNAIAAIGDLVFNHEKNIDDPSLCLKVWLHNLPLKQDDEEAQRVHATLIDLIEANNPLVLGEQHENVGRLVGIMATIYKTNFSNVKIDEKIRNLIGVLRLNNAIENIHNTLTKKQQKKIERIFNDIQLGLNGVGNAAPINN